jgi:AcrR family transcriptional regulator
MKNYPEHMKISELSSCSKISTTTIRHYIRHGLLPKPLMSGKSRAHYTSEHLERLNQITMLKAKGIPINMISEIINGNGGLTMPVGIPDMIHSGKREAIINSAIELFREKGYDLTTVSDIAIRARIGKGTFYNFFQGKEDLFFECADSVFYDIGRDDPVIRDEKNGLRRLWNRAVSFFKLSPQLSSHMIDMLNLLRGASLKDAQRMNQVLSKVMNNLIEPIREDLQMAYDQGLVRFHDLRLLAYIIMGTAEYLTYFFRYHPDSDVEDVLRKTFDVFFGPFPF